MSDAPLPAEARGDAPGRGRLAGRRILVIGAGQDDRGLEGDVPTGNGRAIARLCAREGAAVACADIHGDAAQQTVDLIATERAGSGFAITGNATEEADVERMVAEAVEGLGGLDGLVANVGIGRGGGLTGTTVKQWDLVFAVNVRAHFLALKHGLPAMVDGGAAVLVSSIAALRPGTWLPAYDASKAALGGLVRHAAAETRRKPLRINAVVPGVIDTPLALHAKQRNPNRAADRMPVREGTGWEIAYATVFLLSDEASYVNAHELVVDGGLTGLPTPG